jgi:hypothetical protein
MAMLLVNYKIFIHMILNHAKVSESIPHLWKFRKNAPANTEPT